MSRALGKTPLASISAVERDTGLAKDTLRVWERRYGFPRPSRDANGERVYPADQLEKLRIIRRLIDCGLRPGKIVAAPLEELKAHMHSLSESAPRPDNESIGLSEMMRLLKSHQVVPLRQLLAHALMRLGLQRFVLEVVAPLNELVGNAWMEGRIEIFEEHLYSEQIQHLLRHAIGSASQDSQAPRVLLTTLPGEQHQLGLLMAQACLCVDGAQCISLGVETPSWDILQAARAHRADIVGLSCSQAVPANLARAGVADLRKRLQRKTELWVGGSIWRRVPANIPGVTALASISEIPIALEAWRASHAEG